MKRQPQRSSRSTARVAAKAADNARLEASRALEALANRPVLTLIVSEKEAPLS